MSNQAQTAASALRAQVSKLLDLQFDIENKRADALSKLARYTVLLQSDANDISTIEISIASLAQAIGAMQSVCSIFQQMSDHWKKMENAFTNLGSSSGFAQNMAELVNTPEDEQLSFVDFFFKKAAVEYCAGLTALRIVSELFSTKMSHLGADVAKFVASNPGEAAARSQAKTLAASLGLDVSSAEQAAKDNAKMIAAVRSLVAPNTPARAVAVNG